jgi:hypothetical protein
MEIQLIMNPMTESRQQQVEVGWISLMEYAIKKGISLSTLRRHIKANKIPYKVENGRYLLLDDEKKGFEESREQSANLLLAITQLEMDLQRAREEIAELKTLIAFYEEKIPQDRISN